VSRAIHFCKESKKLKKDVLLSSQSPVYASQAGVDAGMSIILNTQIEDYNISSSDTTGFKVIYKGSIATF